MSEHSSNNPNHVAGITGVIDPRKNGLTGSVSLNDDSAGLFKSKSNPNAVELTLEAMPHTSKEGVDSSEELMDDADEHQHQRLRKFIIHYLRDKPLVINPSTESSSQQVSLGSILDTASKTAASAVTQEFSFQSKDTKDIQSNPTVAVDTHWDNDKSCWQSMATPGNNATRKQQLQACAIALAQAHIAQVFESKQSGLSVSFTVQLGAHGDHVQLIHDTINDYFTAVAITEGFDRSFHATVNFDPSEHEAINKDYPNNTRSNHTKHSLFKGKENSLPSTLNDNSGASNDSFIKTN